MTVQKTILFPFELDSPYFEGFAWAAELAHRMKARLQVFTTVTSSVPTSADLVYHSLLEAQGYYRQHYLHEQIKPTIKLSKPCIAEGEMKAALLSYLKQNPFEIVIIDPPFLSFHKNDIREIVRESGGAIILSEDTAGAQDSATRDDQFYNRLKTAKYHEIGESFFAALGKDHSLFNYLRKFFQISRPKS